LTSFEGFGLNEAIMRAIAEEKYATPTPIQEQTIPLAISRRDNVPDPAAGACSVITFAGGDQ
jgi:ATP-dependent RNA helicase RhlE